ncbi:MAG: SpoIIE family protein phosphatase [Spirochaetales bacterium]|nr:SpoIIE family protein phosphatase [Spirochaetales bacterium]
MQEFVKILTGLPLWNKIFLDIIAVIYFFYIKKLLRSSTYSILGYVLLILLVRDGISSIHAFNRPELYILADLFVLIIYILWNRKFLPESSNILGILLAFLVYMAFLVFSIVISAAGHPLFAKGSIIMRLLRVPVFIYIFILAYNFNKLSPYNIDNPEAQIIIHTRRNFVFMLIIASVLYLVFDENPTAKTAPITFIIVQPLSVLIHLYILQIYSSFIVRMDRQSIKNLTGDLDSLFEFMKTIGNAISERQDISTILDNITSSTAKNLDADGSIILLIDNFDNIIKLESEFGIFPPPFAVIEKVKTKLENMDNYFKNKPIEMGEGVIGKCIQDREPLYVKNTYNDPRFEQNTKNDLMFMSSLIIIPLVASNKTLGALAVCQRDRTKLFTDADFANMKTFADYTSITLDNFFTYMELLDKKEMEREVGIAAEIQQKLLPSRIPKIRDTVISAFTKPAKGVSGDYYDIIKLKGGGIALVMCDVAGKGVPASLVMIMIRTIIQLIAGATRSAATIVSWINKGITGKIDIDHFATLSFLKYDPDTKVVEYSNAGHHPLMLFKAKSKSIESVDTPGLPIGIEPTTEYTQKTIKFEKGDIALLYTDGIIEAMNSKGEQYSYESLVKFVKANYTLNSEELVAGIHNDIKAFVGKAKQHDDQTLLALKVN